jgi:acyl CoA:acetate/3-ketoacid CoA transferase alpha subunit
MVHGAEMRVAETRAVNRALRKAYGIGLCSVEELGWVPRSKTPEPREQQKTSSNENNGHHDGQPRLRDRLCLLIRQHKLDAGLVKAYAADYCGTATLRDASRDQIEAFINSLAESAAKDRVALIGQLNSYSKQQEVV